MALPAACITLTTESFISPSAAGAMFTEQRPRTTQHEGSTTPTSRSNSRDVPVLGSGGLWVFFGLFSPPPWPTVEM